MSRPSTPGFVEPRSLVFWTVIVLVGVGGYWRISSAVDLVGDDVGGLVVPTVAWLAYGLGVGWLIYALQRFERRPVSATLAAVAWGCFVAGGTVAFMGQDFQDLLVKLMGVEAATTWGPAIRAPLEEETTKLLGVVALALIPRVRLTRTIDGLFYGMLSGLGFLVSENIFFTNQEVLAGAEVGSAVMEVVFVRGVLALPISHVAYTGIAGAGIGYFMSGRGRPVGGRLGVALGLYLTAMSLHGFNNSPILETVSGSLFLKGIPTVVIFLLVLRWARGAYRDDLSVLARELPGVTAEDVLALASRRARRQAVKASQAPDAERAAQRARIDLLVAADIYGLASPEATRAETALAGINSD